MEVLMAKTLIPAVPRALNISPEIIGLSLKWGPKTLMVATLGWYETPFASIKGLTLSKTYKAVSKCF